MKACKTHIGTVKLRKSDKLQHRHAELQHVLLITFKLAWCDASGLISTTAVLEHLKQKHPGKPGFTLDLVVQWCGS